jgi:DNA polymerase III sliding clamp (beta) subunit (PCNA family)
MEELPPYSDNSGAVVGRTTSNESPHLITKDKGQFIATVDCFMFKQLVRVLNGLLSGINFIITNSGVTMTALDDRLISVIHVSLKKEFFIDFNVVQNGKELKFGVNLNSLNSALKSYKSDLTISLDIEKDMFEIENKNENDFITIKNEMPLVYLEKIVFSCIVDYFGPTIIDASLFKEMCKIMYNKRNDVDATIKVGNLIFKSHTNFLVMITNLDNYESGYFSIGILEKISRDSCKLSDKVHVYLKNDSPLKLEFQITHSNIDVNVGTLTVLLLNDSEN